MTAPIADFSFAPQHSTPPATSLLVQCTDLSQNSPASWEWHFDNGDGTYAVSTDQNPSHLFRGPPYLWRYVQLTVTNADGSDTKKAGPFPGGVYLALPRT